jgi:hypothetical protein
VNAVFDRIFKQAIVDAGLNEQAFRAALKKEGFKSPIDWFMRAAPESLVDAYNAKVRSEDAQA